MKNVNFCKYFERNTEKNDYHPHGGALQRDDKGKTEYFDSGKEYVMYEPTIEHLYCLLTYLSEVQPLFGLFHNLWSVCADFSIEILE